MRWFDNFMDWTTDSLWHAALVFVVLLIAVLLPAYWVGTESYRQCEAAGGHLVDDGGMWMPMQVGTITTLQYIPTSRCDIPEHSRSQR